MESDQLIICECTADDRNNVLSLWKSAGLTRPWNDERADFDLAVQSSNAAVLRGQVNDTIVAVAMVGFDGHRGWIYYLAVSSTKRSQGYGREIVRSAERWLQAKGAPKVNLLVRTDNLGAAQFYDLLGYRQSAVICMQKVLD